MPRTESAPNVFINCPFDTDYQPIFNAIIFTIFDCGFRARSALELVDSAQNRLERIAQIIEDCDFAVHDISRTEVGTRTGLPRFNMPFELGLYLGARRFGRGRQALKNCLILDKAHFRYQKFLSDIAGQDIAAHHDSARAASACVRNWLSTISGESLPGTQHIWQRFRKFQNDLPVIAKKAKLRLREIQFQDRRNLIVSWLREFGDA